MKGFSIEFTIVPYHKTGKPNNLGASIQAWSQDKLITKQPILWYMKYPSSIKNIKFHIIKQARGGG